MSTLSILSQTNTIDEMDEKIQNYSKLLETVSVSDKPHLQSKLLAAKLMREKLIAMTALARAQTILAEMDVLVAEKNLQTAFDQLDKFKKDHSEASEKVKTHKSTSKSKDLKEAEKSTDILTIDRHGRLISPVEEKNNIHGDKKTDIEKNSQKSAKKTSQNNVDKNSLKTNTDKKTKTPADNKNIHKSRSSTPTNNKKRSHSNSTTSKSKKVKRSNKSKTDENKQSNKTPTNETKIGKTLFDTTMSPIRKTVFITKGVQTTEKQETIPHRILEDDENTVLLEDLSTKTRDVIDLSKALQEILSPTVKNDILKPVSSKLQLMFEDETSERKLRSVKVKTEATGDDICD